MNEQQITQLFRDEWSTLEVGPAPVDAVVAAAGRNRRRIVTSVTLGLAAVLALAVVLAVSIGGEPDVDPVDTVVRSEQNPVDVAWAEGGELHLESVVVRVPAATDGSTEVVSAAQVPDGDSYGVVYSLFDGPVVHVDPDGQALTIDDPGTPVKLVGSGAAWVAWVDPSGDSPELVVWDTESNDQVTRQLLPYDEPAEPTFDERGLVLAVDGETVYVRLPDADLLWKPGMDRPEPVDLADGQRLLDVADGTTLTLNRSRDQVQISPPEGPAQTVRGGSYGRLSADGEYVDPGRPLGVGVRGGPTVLRSSTGEPVVFDVEPDDVVLDSALSSETATFVMGRDFVIPEDIEQDRGGYRQVLLLTCSLVDGSCVVAVDDLETQPTSLSPLLFAS